MPVTQTLMEREIQEGPKALRRLFAGQWGNLKRAAEAIHDRKPLFVVLAARGTSDNAATYARYLMEKEWGIPVSLAASSVLTLYGRKMDYQRGLVVGVSQSGEGPDVCHLVEKAREQGALTVSLTNNPKSRLAKSAQFSIDLMAGLEKSVAATKTYTAELGALYGLVLCASQGIKAQKETARLSQTAEKGCSLSRQIWKVPADFLRLSSCVVVGRGLHYGLALEGALKLKECDQVMAQAYSTADFHHGPKTLVGRHFPAILLVPPGPTLEGSLELLKELNSREAQVMVLSPLAKALKQAKIPVETPHVPEDLSPLGMAPLLQTLALAVATAKGLNPDQPPFLTKITKTK